MPYIELLMGLGSLYVLFDVSGRDSWSCVSRVVSNFFVEVDEKSEAVGHVME